MKPNTKVWVVVIACVLIILLLIWASKGEAQRDPWVDFEATCAYYENNWLRVADTYFVWWNRGSPAAYRWYENQTPGLPYVMVVQVNGQYAGVVTSSMGGIARTRKYRPDLYGYGCWTIEGVPAMTNFPTPNTFGVTFTRQVVSARQDVRFRIYRPRLPWEFQPN